MTKEKEQSQLQEKEKMAAPELKSQQSVWHPPQLQRLQLSIDTGFFVGSSADGTRSTTP